MKNSKQENILFIGHDASKTGAPLILYYIIKWVKANTDFNCTLLLLNDGPLLKEFKKLQIRVFLSNSVNENLVEFILKLNPHVIYGNTVVTAPLIYDYNLVKKTPSILHVHELEVTIETRLGIEKYKKIKGIFDLVIAAGSNVAELLKKYETDNILNIPEFIPCKEIISSIKNKPVETGIKKDFKGSVVIGCGLGLWRKGIDLFVQVAKKVVESNSNVKFIWIGNISPDEMIRLNYDIEKMGLEKVVSFAGSQEIVYPYFAQSDVFLLTSREDPFPLVCLEAACCHLPLICFNKGNGISSFEKANAAIVVDYLDIESMAQHTLELLKNQEKREKLISNGFKYVTQNFDVDVAMAKIIKEVNGLLNKSQKEKNEPELSKISPEWDYNNRLIAEALTGKPANVSPELFYPSNLIEIQIFWANSEMGFKEEKSISKLVKLNILEEIFTFKIPGVNEEIEYLRFDIGNEAGFLNIHQIEIKSLKDESIWKWDYQDPAFKGGILLLSNNEFWPGKIVHFSINNDPQFIIRTNESIKKAAKKGFIINIKLSALNEEQKKQLSEAFISSLSFINEFHHYELIKDYKQLTEQNSSVISENTYQRIAINTLTEQISTHLQTLEDERKLFSSNVQTLDSLISHLTEDKKLLTSELALKGDLLNKSISEKDEVAKILYIKEDLIKQINKSIEDLKLDLAKKEKSRIQIENEKYHLDNLLKETLEQKESFKNELKEQADKNSKLFKREEEKNAGLLNDQKEKYDQSIKNLDKLNDILKVQIDNTNLLLKDQMDRNENFISKIKQLEHSLFLQMEENKGLLDIQKEKTEELTKAVQSIESLKGDIEFLNFKINEYIENYDNSSLGKIMMDRLFKKSTIQSNQLKN